MRDTVSPSDNSCGSCTVLIVNESDKQLKMFHYLLHLTCCAIKCRFVL